MKTAQICWDLIDAWETWVVEVPDDAPDPLTPEWVARNMHRIEFSSLRDSGFAAMTHPEIEW